MKSDINPIVKCKVEIVLYPFINSNLENNNNNNINSIAKDIEFEQSTENDYDFLHYADESTTITDTTIKQVSSNNNNSILSQNYNTQSNYRTLIKMNDKWVNSTSSDDETMRVIKEKNQKTCTERANSIIKDKKSLKLLATHNDSNNELDAILYETGRW
jgi:hypothetical protein